jgi:hypothetical protein
MCQIPRGLSKGSELRSKILGPDSGAIPLIRIRCRHKGKIVAVLWRN